MILFLYLWFMIRREEFSWPHFVWYDYMNFIAISFTRTTWIFQKLIFHNVQKFLPYEPRHNKVYATFHKSSMMLMNNITYDYEPNMANYQSYLSPPLKLGPGCSNRAHHFNWDHCAQRAPHLIRNKGALWSPDKLGLESSHTCCYTRVFVFVTSHTSIIN